MTAILLAVPEVTQEPELVAAASDCGIQIARRCVDAVDLLAAAAADPTVAVVVSAGLPRLGRDALDRISSGRRVVGVADADEPARALRGLGVDQVVMVGSTPHATLRALAAAIESGVPDLDVSSDGPSIDVESPGSGRIIAVWGPLGSPGRTTIAIALAETLSSQRLSTALIDADTYGPSIGMALGMVEDAPGIVVACRHAEMGGLTPDALMASGVRVRPNWLVLGGVAGPSRSAELRPSSLDQVWATCRRSFDITIVDTGFCLEDEPEESAWARRRNAAAVSVMAAADDLVVVADASALGALRLMDSWHRAMSLRGDQLPIIVGNRAHGARAARQWTDALRELGVAAEIHMIPYDAERVARSWGRARAVGEGRRRSAVTRAVRELATFVVSG